MSSERKYSTRELILKLEAFCAYQERCTFEILRKTAEWGCDPKESEAILKELREKGFVDDDRFAASYVTGKFRFKKWGRIKLRAELRAKRIPDDLIKISLATIDPGEYSETLNQLARKKWAELKGKDLWTSKAKLIRFLASKGYELDLINDSVAQLISSE